MKRLYPGKLLSFVFLLLSAIASWCADRPEYLTLDWIGGSGNWSDPANWEDGRVPHNSDEFVFNTFLPREDVNVTNDVATAIHVLVVRAQTKLQVNQPFYLRVALSLYGGLVRGPAPIHLEDLDVAPAFVPGVHAVLDGYSLSPTGSVAISGPLELKHYPEEGRFSRILCAPPLIESFNYSRFHNGGSIRVSPRLPEPDLDLRGGLVIRSDEEPFLCEGNVATRVRLDVYGSLVMSNANFLHDGGPVRFDRGEMLNHSTEPNYGHLTLISSSITGTGHVDVARIGAPAGSSSELRGRFSFGDVVISNNVTVHLKISGVSEFEYDRISVSNRLTYYPRLELHFGSDFENQVSNSDVFEILSCAPGTLVDGGFENVIFGGRINVDDRGSFLIERAAPGSDSIVLRDWQPITFELSAASGPLVHGLSGDALDGQPFAVLTQTGPVLWSGGTVHATVGTQFVPGQDRWSIRSTGVGPGQILTQRSAVDLDTFIISYGGVPFASARWFLPDRPVSAGRDLLCTLYSSATTPAIEALLRSIQYRNETYGYELFETNINAVYPPRLLQFFVRDSQGLTVREQREVQFPKVVKLVCSPPTIYVSSSVPARMTASAIFDTGDFSQRLGGQVSYTPSHPALLTLATLPGGIQQVSFSGVAPVEEECKILAGAGGFSGECCVDLVGHAGALIACILRALGFSEVCEPDPFSPSSGSAITSLSLATFHSLESLMMQTTEGRRLADLYRQHTTEIVDISFARPNLIPEARTLVMNWQGGVNALLAGRGTNVAISQSMINALNALWNQYTNHASPALRTVLQTERARFNNFQDFVGKNFNQWATMLQLPVPTIPLIQLSSAARSNQTFRAEANLVTNLSYTLQRSADLASWTFVPNQQLTTNGLTVKFADTNAVPTNYFYRAIAQP